MCTWTMSALNHNGSRAARHIPPFYLFGVRRILTAKDFGDRINKEHFAHYLLLYLAHSLFLLFDLVLVLHDLGTRLPFDH